jgi:hypothetical protein
MAAVEVGGHLKRVVRLLVWQNFGKKKNPPILLKKEEKNALTTYMGKIQDCGHPLTMQ